MHYTDAILREMPTHYRCVCGLRAADHMEGGTGCPNWVLRRCAECVDKTPATVRVRRTTYGKDFTYLCITHASINKQRFPMAAPYMQFSERIKRF